MDDATHSQARGILEACRRAWGYLNGPGPAKKRVGAARMCFSAYTKEGLLAPHVRDVYNAHTLLGIESGLRTLQQLAEAFSESESETS
ncbi:MAG: hypothetical protein JWL61_5438 [Gemmatimonadetes bacterium]|nr:hypothetical protein [Gemmatimonadota bacterium]